jgi:hypothetical protein
MSKPKRSVVRMVSLLIRWLIHWPITRKGNACRTDHRIKIRPRNVGEEVFSEQMSTKFDSQSVRKGRDLDS